MHGEAPPTARPAHRRKVGLFIPNSYHWASDMLPGINRVVREAETWELLHTGYMRNSDTFFRALRDFHVEGVIGFFPNPELLARLPASVRAVVNVSNRSADIAALSVVNDDRLVGQLAANHLAAAGYHHLAFYGFPDEHFGTLRLRGFREAAATHGRTVNVFTCRHEPYAHWSRWLAAVTDWMSRLPVRTGILASDDANGNDLLTLAADLARPVPADLGIMGVNNDLARVHSRQGVELTSVATDLATVGERAARLLQNALEGAPLPPEGREVVPPRGVIVRSSTDRRFVEGPLVGRAVQLIESDPARSWRVQDLAEAVHVSPRVLERQFARTLGHSPKDEIDAIRLRHALSLLADPNRTISEIAAACGFDEPRGLTLLFRRKLGITPSQARATEHSR